MTTIRLAFEGDSGNLLDDLGTIFDSSQNTTDRLDALGRAATVASGLMVAGIGAAAYQFGQMASVQEQALGGAGAVFKENVGQIEAWADAAANSVGLAKTEYLQLAAPIGASLKAVGFSLDQATDSTKTLIERGADLAATFGGPTSEAVDAMGAALRGEFDPLERYGIALTQATVDAELAARGMSDLGDEAKALAQKQVVMDLILEQSADSMGQFASESDTAAGAAERSRAMWENLQAELGQAVLPVLLAVGQALQPLIQYLSDHSDVVVVATAVIGGLSAAFLVYKGIVTIMPALTAAWTAAQWLWNAALTANPIGIVIVAIGALVAAFVWLFNNVEGFRNFWVSVWNGAVSIVQGAVGWIRDIWGGIIGWFSSTFGNLGSGFQRLGQAIRAPFEWAFNGIRWLWNNGPGRINFSIPSWVPGIGGQQWGFPKFHAGGVVPGPNAEMMAVLQAGERVIPRGQGMSGSGTTVTFVGNTSDALATVIMQLIRTRRIILS